MKTNILRNAATGRYHPIVYRPAPSPGPPSTGKPMRYKSLGHHTDGFDTHDEATKWLASDPRYEPPMAVMEWDGFSMPTHILFVGDETPEAEGAT